ncbi:MAG: peptidylprolyl isomerase [Bdellovibrionales bacterium]|nr:peptidylprolyl isomerase [Bdellovibrionales bacterium]
MKMLGIAFTLFFTGHVLAQTVATVGGQKITAEEFKRRLDDVNKQAMNPPSKEQYLEDLVRFKIGVQEAEKIKLQNDPLVKERFEQVLYNSLLEKQLGSKVEQIKITDAEMKDFYKKNPELRLAHILIDIKPDATTAERDAAKKRALEILDDVKKSKRPFEELVKLYSDDVATKEMGGDIGYQSRVTLVPMIYDQAMRMRIGEVRGLVETKYGFHILKLIDHRSYDLADKRQIRAALFDDKRAKIFNDYFDKLKKQYKIEINKEALKALK